MTSQDLFSVMHPTTAEIKYQNDNAPHIFFYGFAVNSYEGVNLEACACFYSNTSGAVTTELLRELLPQCGVIGQIKYSPNMIQIPGLFNPSTLIPFRIKSSKSRYVSLPFIRVLDKQDVLHIITLFRDIITMT